MLRYHLVSFLLSFYFFANNLQAYVKYSKTTGSESHPVNLGDNPTLEGEYFFHTKQKDEDLIQMYFVGLLILTDLSLDIACWVHHQEHCTITLCHLRTMERNVRNV